MFCSWIANMKLPQHMLMLLIVIRKHPLVVCTSACSPTQSFKLIHESIANTIYVSVGLLVVCLCYLCLSWVRACNCKDINIAYWSVKWNGVVMWWSYLSSPNFMFPVHFVSYFGTSPCAEAISCLVQAVDMFCDIGRISMAARYLKVYSLYQCWSCTLCCFCFTLCTSIDMYVIVLSFTVLIICNIIKLQEFDNMQLSEYTRDTFIKLS